MSKCNTENAILKEEDAKKEKFMYTFKRAYRLLGEYGSKKSLHADIVKHLHPHKSYSIIRRYCTCLEAIPDNQKHFYFPLLGNSLYFHLSKHIDEFQLFINEVKELLSEMELQLDTMNNNLDNGTEN